MVNGSVNIAGKTATFKASACDLASWKLTVNDRAGSSMSKDVVAFVVAAAGASCP